MVFMGRGFTSGRERGFTSGRGHGFTSGRGHGFTSGRERGFTSGRARVGVCIRCSCMPKGGDETLFAISVEKNPAVSLEARGLTDAQLLPS